jgi:hypothetical protein
MEELVVLLSEEAVGTPSQVQCVVLLSMHSEEAGILALTEQ